MSNDKIEKFLIDNNILFKFDSNNSKYHPILTSGLHSNMYFNTVKLIESAAATQMMLQNLFKGYNQMIDVALSCNSIGGLLTLGSHLAFIITETFNHFRCKQRIVFNKKDSINVSYWPENEIKEPLLIVDDVISTGSSIRDLINRFSRKIELSPYILVFVNRFGSRYIDINDNKFEIISSYTMNCKVWKSTKCPLCLKYNSTPLRPKDNWNLFTNK